MIGRLSRRLALLLVATVAVSPGCDGGTPSTAAPVPATAPATAPVTAAVAVPGHFTGRITFADGSPITLPGVEYSVTTNGITAVGEAHPFKPPVGPDGTFKLKLPQGLFKPPYATITVPFEGKKYCLHLDPVDPVKGMRDGVDGITQNFVWRLTGPRPGARNPDVNNATHWFGSTIRLIASTFREDIQQKVKPLPDGSKITWTVKPTSKLIDGSESKPLTVERTWGGSVSEFDVLNDLPPANYEVAAVATLPDGSTKPLLLYNMDDRRYKPTTRLVLEPDESLCHYVYLPRQLSWAVE